MKNKRQNKHFSLTNGSSRWILPVILGHLVAKGDDSLEPTPSQIETLTNETGGTEYRLKKDNTKEANRGTIVVRDCRLSRPRCAAQMLGGALKSLF